MEGKPPPPNPAMPYRDDCWSEGATSTLIDAWGDRYLELNRGNLRQKHWQEVADTVNTRRGSERRPSRTDIQCKNRIDTLKKKYKVERARVLGSGGAAGSQWPFYSRLDVLIGTSVLPTSSKRPSPSSPPLALPLPFHRKGSPLPAAAAAAAARPLEKRRPPPPAPALPQPVDGSFFRRNYSVAAAAAAAAAAAEAASADDDDDEDDEKGSDSSPSSRSSGGRSAKRPRKEVLEQDEGIRQLAQAIAKFGEIYEKVEAAKQRQMMELEKQRLEFSKGLEFQRMQIFVDSQIKLAKIRRGKKQTQAGELRSAVSSLIFQPAL